MQRLQSKPRRENGSTKGGEREREGQMKEKKLETNSVQKRESKQKRNEYRPHRERESGIRERDGGWRRVSEREKGG